MPRNGPATMKVLSPCIRCMEKETESSRTGGTSILIRFLAAEINDDGVVYLTCENGHQTVIVDARSKYQILFTSGCQALLDDYTNEAVSSISAALERAYEFFIRVVYRKLGVSPTLLESSWKQIRHYSERQFGAFVMLFPIVAADWFNLPPEVPELRNKVIHRGYIARSDEVRNYARTVFLIIRKIVQILNDKCSTEMWAEKKEAAEEVQKKAVPPGMKWMWAMKGLEFDLVRDLTFDTWLTKLKEELKAARRNVE